MKTSKTFSIRFWLKKTGKQNSNQLPVYARITVDGKRADISMKRYVDHKHWCTKSGRVNQRVRNAKAINQFLDQEYMRLLQCQSQILKEKGHLTAQAIKMRYLGEDIAVSTLSELIKHHYYNEMGKLEEL
jgi:hypothetical protein